MHGVHQDHQRVVKLSKSQKGSTSLATGRSGHQLVPDKVRESFCSASVPSFARSRFRVNGSAAGPLPLKAGASWLPKISLRHSSVYMGADQRGGLLRPKNRHAELDTVTPHNLLGIEDNVHDPRVRPFSHTSTRDHQYPGHMTLPVSSLPAPGQTKGV